MMYHDRKVNNTRNKFSKSVAKQQRGEKIKEYYKKGLKIEHIAAIFNMEPRYVEKSLGIKREVKPMVEVKKIVKTVMAEPQKDINFDGLPCVGFMGMQL